MDESLLSSRANRMDSDESEILALAKKLVEAKIDVNTTNSFDKTPLAIAQDKGYDSIVTYLEQL